MSSFKRFQQCLILSPGFLQHYRPNPPRPMAGGEINTPQVGSVIHNIYTQIINLLMMIAPFGRETGASSCVSGETGY